MDSPGRSRWTIAASAFALCATAMLGNLRLQASELRADAMSARVPASIDSPFLTGAADRLVDSDVDGESIADAGSMSPASEEPAQLVPAIYAWDPDVRFVYYRHVSKWM